MRSSRFFSAALSAVVLSALAGGFFGSSLLARQDDLQQQYRIFAAAMSAIEREYIDEVPSERLDLAVDRSRSASYNGER